MAITITVDLVKARYPSIACADATIQDFIDYISASVLPCLELSYSEPVARLIAYSLIAHFCEMASGRRVKSQSAPNGASQSYDFGYTKQGLGETAYGRLVMQMDTEGCTSAIVDEGFGLFVVGGNNENS